MVGYFILATSVVAAVYGAVWYGRWLAKIGPPNWYRRRLTAKRGESHMIDIRRGMTRLGVVLLVLWELPLFYFWATDQPALTWTYVHAAIVPPLIVWICWRTVLWIVRGFVSERAR